MNHDYKLNKQFTHGIITFSLLDLLLMSLFFFASNTSTAEESFNSKPNPSLSPPPSLLGTFFYAWYGGKNQSYYGWSISNHHPPPTWGSNYIPNINSLKFDPSKELYSSNDTVTIKNQLTLLKRAGIQFGITDWYEIGHFEDEAFSKVIKEIMPSKINPYPTFKWTLLYEREGYKNLTAKEIISDLEYIKSKYTSSPYYLKIDRRPVIFVYNTFHKGHTLLRDAAKWSLIRNQTGFYVVMKDDPLKYKVDPTIVDGWYDYDPTKRYDQIGNYSASISPGYWKFHEPPMLVRNITDFEKAAQKLASTKVHFKLIETWNEWYEGTSIEPGQQIIHDDIHGFKPASSSYGNTYVDILAKYFTHKGRVFVTGHDPDYHAYMGPNKLGAQHIVQRAITYVTAGKPNPKLLLVTDLRNPGGDQSDPRLGMKASGFSSFDVADYGSNAPGVLDLKRVNFTKYDAVVVSSSTGGWLRQDELDILNTRSTDLNLYVNNGGGIVAFNEVGERQGGYPGTSHNLYAFVPSIGNNTLISKQFQEEEVGFNLTKTGVAMGLSGNDINGNYLHSIFVKTGGIGMNIIDQDAAGRIASLSAP